MKQSIEGTHNIKIVVTGKPEDNGDVRLDDFSKVLDRWKRLLNEAERITTGQKLLYYRVVNLSHNSPATIILEPVVEPAFLQIVEGGYINNVAKTLDEAAQELSGGGEVSERFDSAFLSAFYEVADNVGNNSVAEMKLAVGKNEYPVGEVISLSAKQILGEEVFEIGSVTGRLERLNIHGTARTCHIYPKSGAPKVKCTFSSDKINDVITAVGKFVTVYGALKYRGRQLHAEELTRVTDIEVHPLDADLPDLYDLRGTVDGPLRIDNAW